MYDMPLRDYDPAIGRWVVQDPVIHHSQSTYSSFNGNPVLFADPTGGKGQMLDENGARKYDDNGNYIWRGDRVAPGEVSMVAYGSGGSTVEKMISKINGLSDAKKAILPPPHILLQLLMAEESSGGNWEKLFKGMGEYSENGSPIIQSIQTEIGSVLITITNEIVGFKTIKDWPSNFGGKYQTPLYKVVVSGTDIDGNVVSRTFEAIRFGVKTNTDGSKKVSFLRSGSYVLEDFFDSMYGNSGAFQIIGNYLIHMNSLVGADGNNGCIAIAGGRAMWNQFKAFISQLTFSSNLQKAAKAGKIQLIIQAAKTPKLF